MASLGGREIVEEADKLSSIGLRLANLSLDLPGLKMRPRSVNSVLPTPGPRTLETLNSLSGSTASTATISSDISSTASTSSASSTAAEAWAAENLNGHHIEILYHCTKESNANNIIQTRAFRPGQGGYLGPGIYFTRSKRSARRFCQCRTGDGQFVVLRCEVNLGKTLPVGRGCHTRTDLDWHGADSFDEVGRDCLMLLDNSNNQINMDTIRIA